MRHLAPPESSSSGFISSSSRESTLLKESQPPQITRWENRIGSRSSSPKIEERRTAAANESLSSSRPTSDEQQYLVRPRPLKPIRMDIDLNRPVTSTSTTVKRNNLLLHIYIIYIYIYTFLPRLTIVNF
jgi:hypothetical protein